MKYKEIMKMETKRNFWLKCGKEFFGDRRTKRLKKSGCGLLEIYIQMLCLVLPTAGSFDLEPGETLAEAFALELDEDEERTAATIEAAMAAGLLEQISETSFYFPHAAEFTGSETDSAERMRRHRERKKASHCDGDVTECNANVTESDANVTSNTELKPKQDKASHCDAAVTGSDAIVTTCDTEKEKELKEEGREREKGVIGEKEKTFDLGSKTKNAVLSAWVRHCANAGKPPQKYEGYYHIMLNRLFNTYDESDVTCEVFSRIHDGVTNLDGICFINRMQTATEQ